MRSLFEIPSEKETRLWNKYMSNTYEQLNKPDSTVQDAGLFQGQVHTCYSYTYILEHLWKNDSNNVVISHCCYLLILICF